MNYDDVRRAVEDAEAKLEEMRKALLDAVYWFDQYEADYGDKHTKDTSMPLRVLLARTGKEQA